MDTDDFFPYDMSQNDTASQLKDYSKINDGKHAYELYLDKVDKNVPKKSNELNLDFESLKPYVAPPPALTVEPTKQVEAK